MQKKQFEKIGEAVRSVTQHFERKPPSAKAKANDNALANAEALKVPLARNRFFASIGNELEHIRFWSPDHERTMFDECTGRYLLAYGGERESFSWTCRGHGTAAELALNWAWERHTPHPSGVTA